VLRLKEEGRPTATSSPRLELLWVERSALCGSNLRRRIWRIASATFTAGLALNWEQNCMWALRASSIPMPLSALQSSSFTASAHSPHTHFP
jgi:hypothetical protein